MELPIGINMIKRAQLCGTKVRQGSRDVLQDQNEMSLGKTAPDSDATISFRIGQAQVPYARQILSYGFRYGIQDCF